MSKKVSNKIIGIDLGTTNSCVSIDGKVIQREGKNTTPSIVLFDEKGEKVVSVGQTAAKQTIVKPKQVVFEVKRLIGRSFNSKEDLKEIKEFQKAAPFQIIPAENGDARVKIANKEYSPQQISAFILEAMKKTAEDYLGETVKKAVITVPAYFNDAQRQATVDAALIAGFGDVNDKEKTRQMVRIINEPTAAALAYGIEKKKKNQTIAVFDLGGGTFDISIITIDKGVFEVKATNGDTYLGGANFDQKIVDWLIKEFKNEHGIDLKEKDDKLALQQLKKAAEGAKHDLSSMESVDILLPFLTSDASGPKGLIRKLSRFELKELTADLLEKLTLPCENCIKDAGIAKKDIEEVILVGGMTRMLAVQEKVKEIFGKEPSKSVNPDEAVAVGASIQGGVMAGDTKDVLLLDVTPLSLGIETQGIRGEGGLFHVMIPRNTTIPTDKKEIFSTAEDNQPSVHIRVLQGERAKASDKDVKVLGTFELSGIEPAPRGVPQIEVTFDIDENGILKVSAKDKKTNKEANITITGGSGLSKEEVEKIVKEAEKMRAEDEEIRNNVDTFNRAQTHCRTFEKQIEEFKKHKDFKEDDPQFQEFKKLYDNLKENLKEIEESKEESKKKEKYAELKEKVKKIEEMIKLSLELQQKMSKENEEKKDEGEEAMDVELDKKDDDKK